LKCRRFFKINIPVDPGGGCGAGGSNREDEEDNAGGQRQGLGTARHHERLQGDVPGPDQASKLLRFRHRLNMEVDLQSLFGLHVT
jgi:hypothetical protein